MTGFSDHAAGSDELIPFDDRSSLVAWTMVYAG
jgi:hypothetical protein